MIKISKGMLVSLCASTLALTAQAQTIQVDQVRTRGIESQELDNSRRILQRDVVGSRRGDSSLTYSSSPPTDTNSTHNTTKTPDYYEVNSGPRKNNNPDEYDTDTRVGG